MKLLCGDDDDRLWIFPELFKLNPWRKWQFSAVEIFKRRQQNQQFNFLRRRRMTWTGSGPAAKVIPTPLTLTCVQTTEHIRTRSDRVFTVLSS
jgi:hypothetical protein